MGDTPSARATPLSKGASDDIAAMGVSRKLTATPKANTAARKP